MNNEEKKALEEVLGKIFGTEVEIVEDAEEEVVATEEQVEAQKIARAVLEKAGYCSLRWRNSLYHNAKTGKRYDALARKHQRSRRRKISA